MKDTSPVIAKKFYELMKKRSNEERLLAGCSMFDTSKAIVISSIYNRSQKISPAGMKKELFLRFYGAEFSEPRKKKILNVLLCGGLVLVFALLAFIQPASAQTSISYGEIVSDSISTAGQKDEFVFSGTSREVIVILSSGTSGNLIPYLELYDSSGNKVQENYSAILGYGLQSSGTFKIVLRDYELRNTGNYELSLYRISNPTNTTAINFSQTVSATLSSPVKVDAYRFSATANEKIYIALSILPDSAEYFRPVLYLCDVSGNVLAQSDAIGILSKTLTNGGTFYLFVGNGSLSGIGSYTFTLSRWQNPTNFTDINFGQTASGSLNVANEIKVYRISGSANDKVYNIWSELSQNSGNFYPSIALYDTAGNLIPSWQTEYKKSLHTLPSTGDFYIFLRDIFYNGTGTYELTVQRTNEPANVKVLNYNSVVEDSLEVVTGINVYRFTANANERVTLCSAVKTETSGYFRGYLELYDVTGSRLAYASESLEYTFTTGGTFYLFITDSYQDGTGIYRFILLNSDISCSDIDFVSPQVSLLKPQTGEVIESDSTYAIIWNSSDNAGISSQEIRLSTDSGLTYPTVIASDLGTGIRAYNWRVSAALTTTKARVKIIAKDTAGNQNEDANKGDFAIMPTTLPPEAKEINYEYDSLSQLTKSISSAVDSVAYRYDALGNRLSLDVTGTSNPPTAPTNLAATATSSSQINLSWTDNSNNEQGFKIEYSLSSSSGFTEIATVGANITTYSNTGLNANTTYYYRVRAYNSAGNSAYSNTASATTAQVPPQAPSNLQATAASSSQINLSWQDNSNNEDGFKIERSTQETSGFTEIASIGVDVTSYRNTGLNAGITYYYRVRAYNSAGNSGYSNTANATTLQAPPAAPSNLTASAVSSSQINLAWIDNSNNEDGFKIERSKKPKGKFKQIATVGANITTYTNTGLKRRKTYYYRIRAYNTDGNSQYSNIANARTP